MLFDIAIWISQLAEWGTTMNTFSWSGEWRGSQIPLSLSITCWGLLPFQLHSTYYSPMGLFSKMSSLHRNNYSGWSFSKAWNSCFLSSQWNQETHFAIVASVFNYFPFGPFSILKDNWTWWIEIQIKNKTKLEVKINHIHEHLKKNSSPAIVQLHKYFLCHYEYEIYS